MSWWIDAPREGFTDTGMARVLTDVDGLSRPKRGRPKGITLPGEPKRRQRVRVTNEHHRGGPGAGKRGVVMFVGGHCGCGGQVSEHEWKKKYRRCRACRKATYQEPAA